MIEIDLGLFTKEERGTHIERVKVTRGGKTFYREQRVGRKKEEKNVIGKSYLSSKFEERFGLENMNRYSEFISLKSDEELIGEFKILTLDDKEFANEFISEWYRGSMWKNDGWITKELKLSGKSRWSTRYQGVAETPGKIDSFMKFYLLNQEYLKRKFPNNKVVLYRGLSSKSSLGLIKDSMIKTNDNDLSSWTELFDVGEFFASGEKYGAVLRIEVPIEDILMTTRLVGEYDDGNDPTEVILVKNKNEGKVVSLKKYENELLQEESKRKADVQWEEIK